MNPDVGKLGRGYLIALLLGMTALGLLALFVGIGREVLNAPGKIDPDEMWLSLAVMLVAILLFGADLWGVTRRHRWSYYLSLAICAYWISMTAYSLAEFRQWNTKVPMLVQKWLLVTFLVLYVVAFGWLLLPSARAQFSPLLHKQ